MDRWRISHSPTSATSYSRRMGVAGSGGPRSRDRIRARVRMGALFLPLDVRTGSSGERVLSVVGGRPTYLQLAHQFAEWFEANMSRFLDAPSTQVRALAVAVRACISYDRPRRDPTFHHA